MDTENAHVIITDHVIITASLRPIGYPVKTVGMNFNS